MDGWVCAGVAVVVETEAGDTVGDNTGDRGVVVVVVVAFGVKCCILGLIAGEGLDGSASSLGVDVVVVVVVVVAGMTTVGFVASVWLVGS
jgi:hypothetical protein